MNTTTLQFLPFWLACGLFVVLGFALIAWSLRWDRDAWQRRCPKCWYSLDGIESLQCPECGRTAKTEQALHKRRYRWRITFAGVMVIAMGYVAGSWPNLRHGWRGLVPTTVLLFRETMPNQRTTTAPSPSMNSSPSMNPLRRSIAGASSLASSEPWTWTEELFGRYVDGSLWWWQQRWLIDRDLDACVHMRDTWLEDAPLALEISKRWFASAENPRELRVRLKGVADSEARLQIYAHPSSAGATGLSGAFTRFLAFESTECVLAPIPAGSTEVTLEIELWEFDEETGSHGRKVYERELVKPVRLTTRPGVILAEDATEKTSDWIKTWLKVKAVANGTLHTCHMAGLPPWRAIFDPEATGRLTFGMVIEVLRDGEVIAWVGVNPADVGTFLPPRWEGNSDAVFDADLDDPAWQVRVRSHPAISICDFDATECWIGEFTAPASAVLVRSDGRSKMPKQR